MLVMCASQGSGIHAGETSFERVGSSAKTDLAPTAATRL
jgi:hypothetical protein